MYFTLQGFEYHIKNDYNMWSYFALYLNTIHHLDHNALEEYVDDKVSFIMSQFVKSININNHKKFERILFTSNGKSTWRKGL